MKWGNVFHYYLCCHIFYCILYNKKADEKPKKKLNWTVATLPLLYTRFPILCHKLALPHNWGVQPLRSSSQTTMLFPSQHMSSKGDSCTHNGTNKYCPMHLLNYTSPLLTMQEGWKSSQWCICSWAVCHESFEETYLFCCFSWQMQNLNYRSYGQPDKENKEVIVNFGTL